MIEALHRELREEMDRFLQNQLQQFHQQQQANTYQHPFLYHTVTGKATVILLYSLIGKSNELRLQVFKTIPLNVTLHKI